MNKKISSLLALAGLACLAPGIASAGFLTFDFTNTGLRSYVDCDSGAANIDVRGVAFDPSNDVPGTLAWEFDGALQFTGISCDAPTASTAGSWQFVDYGPAGNSLWGTLSALLEANTQTLQTSYTITGGSGLFEGATGFGWGLSDALFSAGEWFTAYVEQGRMFIRSRDGAPTAVSEPGITGLFAAALILVGVMGLRRRHAYAIEK
ncbi:MAG: hypothetical protein IRZ28_12715 [Steroidobacteraceae bacterium]|nr:hypothetical protein [Steroidobacteraceae bacterium]